MIKPKTLGRQPGLEWAPARDRPAHGEAGQYGGPREAHWFAGGASSKWPAGRPIVAAQPDRMQAVSEAWPFVWYCSNPQQKKCWCDERIRMLVLLPCRKRKEF